MADEKYYTKEELTGRAPAGWTVALSTVGLLAIAAGILMPLLNITWHLHTTEWCKYLYAGGALCFLVGKLMSPYRGSHPRIKRLYRIESWAAIFFCVAAFFIFYYKGMTRDVWAFTLAGGALLVFTSLAIPAAIKKEMTRSAGKKTKK